MILFLHLTTLSLYILIIEPGFFQRGKSYTKYLHSENSIFRIRLIIPGPREKIKLLGLNELYKTKIAASTLQLLQAEAIMTFRRIMPAYLMVQSVLLAGLLFSLFTLVGKYQNRPPCKNKQLTYIKASVKHGDFKKCDQSGFCKRNRQYADQANSLGSDWISPYRIDVPSLKIEDGFLTGIVLKKVDGSEDVKLPLTVSFLKSGVARVELDEEKRKKGEIELRHGSKARKERYNEAAKWAIVGGLDLGSTQVATSEATHTVIKYGPGKEYEAFIYHHPFRVEFVRDGKIQVKFNGKGLMNVEHWRPKIEPPPVEEGKEGEKPASEPTVDESTWWDETFGGNTDSKPRGPESIALDITFPGYEHVFGIPEHAGPLSLRETRYDHWK
jgi:hypothetical protein